MTSGLLRLTYHRPGRRSDRPTQRRRVRRPERAPRRAVGAASSRLLLDGLHPFGHGRDPLVVLLADVTAAPAGAELRGEAEALLAFRAGRAYLAQGRVHDHAPAPRPTLARRAAARPSALPVIGSVLAVAASAAIGVLAYSASAGLPDWTRRATVPAVVDRVGSPAPATGARGASGGGQPGASAVPGSRSGPRASHGAGGAAPFADPAVTPSAGGPPNPNQAGIAAWSPRPTPSGTAAGGDGTGTPSGGTVSLAPGPGTGTHPTTPVPQPALISPLPVVSPSAGAVDAPSAGAAAVSPRASGSSTGTRNGARTVGVASAGDRPLASLCTAWFAQGGGAGGAGADPVYLPLLAMAGSPSRVSTFCGSTLAAPAPGGHRH